MQETVTTDVLVLGLGAFGSAALYQLARSGISAIGVDRFSPPHDRGSSHGATRITRAAVGEGEDYVPFVMRSHRIWRELEAATGRELMTSCGALVFAPRHAAASHHGKDRFVDRTIAAARRFGIAHDVLNAAAIADRFPQFELVGDEVGCFEPGGGFLRPEACIAAQLDEARRLGATIRAGERVEAVLAVGDTVEVRTDQGRVVAKRAIACLGPWTAPLVGDAFRDLLVVNLQTLYWFETPAPRRYEPDQFPVYIWMHGEHESDYFYGFPYADAHGGLKVATEQYGVAADPDDDRRSDGAPDARAASTMYERHVQGHLRGVTARCAHQVNCFYTVTPDRGFLIDRHPRIPGLTVVSACSGHGFKHSAGVGQALAAHAIDAPNDLDLTPFSLARFTPQRRVDAETV